MNATFLGIRAGVFEHLGIIGDDVSASNEDIHEEDLECEEIDHSAAGVMRLKAAGVRFAARKAESDRK